MKLASIICASMCCIAPVVMANDGDEDSAWLYKDVFLDGPQYSINELWNAVGHRSPYTVYLGVSTSGARPVKVQGLQKMKALVDLTRSELERTSGMEMLVQRKDNCILFVRTKQYDPSEETTLPEPVAVNSSDGKEGQPLDVQVLGLAKSAGKDDFQDARTPGGFDSDNSWNKILGREAGMGRHVYPAFRVSGLQGLGFTPSLRGMRGIEGGRLNVEFDSSYIREKYKGADATHVYNVSGALYKEQLRLSHWLNPLNEVSAELSAGIHDADMAINKMPTVPLMRTRNLKFNTSDLVLSARHLLIQKDGFTLMPAVDIKLPLAGRGDAMTSGQTDTALSIEFLKENGKTDLIAKVGYVMPGNLDVFRPGVASWDQDGYATLSVGVGQPLSDVDYLSLALNYSQNPLRGATYIQDLSGDITTFGALYRRPLHDQIKGQVEVATGLTQAAPDFSLSFGVSASF